MFDGCHIASFSHPGFQANFKTMRRGSGNYSFHLTDAAA